MNNHHHFLSVQRFEHSSSKHKKISTRIQFPQFLDMTPFMASQKSTRSQTSCSLSDNRYVSSLHLVFVILTPASTDTACLPSLIIRVQLNQDIIQLMFVSMKISGSNVMMPSSLKPVLVKYWTVRGEFVSLLFLFRLLNVPSLTRFRYLLFYHKDVLMYE